MDGSGTTIYIGDHFEKHIPTGAATSYYFVGGQRVALRVGGAVRYLHSDHLGSTT